MPTRRAAKQNAAFQACIALHRADALDDHLLPLRASRSDDAPEDVDGRALDRRPLPSNLEVQLVNPFGNVFASSAAHVYVFEVSTQPPARIAMVCGADVEVPPRTLYDSDGGISELHLLAHDRLDWQNWAERDDRLSALETFNRRLSRVVLNRRFGDDRIYALWSPVDEAGNLDWELVADPFEVADFARIASRRTVAAPHRALWSICRSASRCYGGFTPIRDRARVKQAEAKARCETVRLFRPYCTTISPLTCSP